MLITLHRQKVLLKGRAYKKHIALADSVASAFEFRRNKSHRKPFGVMIAYNEYKQHSSKFGFDIDTIKDIHRLWQFKNYHHLRRFGFSRGLEH